MHIFAVIASYRIELKTQKQKHIPTLGSRVTSLVSVSLVLFLLGIMALTGIIACNLNTELRHNLGFIVRMQQGASEQSIATAKQALMASKAVNLLTFVSADDIYAQEQSLMGEDFAQLLDANPYSAEFDVKVHPKYAFTDSIEKLSAFFATLPDVDEVISESTIIDGLDRTIKRFSIIISALIILLGIIAIALIRNAVFLTIYSRRFIIYTMKLVGASASFIRRPFIRAAIVNGILAAIIATALICAMLYYATSYDAIFTAIFTSANIAIVGGTLLVCGVLICGITAIAATNKYIYSSYDEMFLK